MAPFSSEAEWAPLRCFDDLKRHGTRGVFFAFTTAYTNPKYQPAAQIIETTRSSFASATNRFKALLPLGPWATEVSGGPSTAAAVTKLPCEARRTPPRPEI